MVVNSSELVIGRRLKEKYCRFLIQISQSLLLVPIFLRCRKWRISKVAIMMVFLVEMMKFDRVSSISVRIKLISVRTTCTRSVIQVPIRSHRLRRIDGPKNFVLDFYFVFVT